MNKKMSKYFLFLLGLSLCALNAFGQGKDDRIRPVTYTVALKNVFIVQSPGADPVFGNIVIKNGLISAVGENAKLPINAKVLEGDSLYVYAGFIDGLSHAGVPKPKGSNNSRSNKKPNDTGNPTNERAGIQPDLTLAKVLKPDDSSVESLRKLGFTMTHSVPYGRMLPGQGAVILLKGETVDEMIYREDAAIFAQLVSASGVYPGTLIGVMSKFRELYKQAEQMKAYEQMYETSPEGMERPVTYPAHRALYAATEGTQPIFFMAEDMLSIHRIMTLQKDLGFNLVLAGVKEGWQVADLIKEKQIPIFLSLDLPKEIETKKEETKPAEATAMTTKGGALESEKEKLEMRRNEELKKRQQQAATMKTAGISFGFATIGAKANDIRKHLNTMIKNGLSESDALAALTTQPAKFLGLENVAGTIETGKLGNLVVSDKPYFAEKSNVRYVLVEGNVFEYEVKKKKKGSKATVDPSGTWTYSFEAAGNTMSGTMTIKKDGDSYSGKMTSPMTGQEGEMESFSINGNEIAFSVSVNAQGQSITVDYEMTVDGDAMDGKVTAGQYGTFDVSAQRKSKPEQE